VELLAAHVREALSAELPQYMVPGAYVMLEAFPLTENGKIDRRALPAPDNSLTQDSYVAPQTVTETKLVEIWAELLHLPKDKISADADFFSLGGHSLLMVRLVSAIDSTFGVRMTLKGLFSKPTIISMAQSIDVIERTNNLGLELADVPDDQLDRMEF
jgi:acyl carrier protein